MQNPPPPIGFLGHFQGVEVPPLADERAASRGTLVWAGVAGLVLGALAALVLVHGPALLDVRKPLDEGPIGVEGVEVLVGFLAGHTRSATFRATLNGADVTNELELAANGVHGSLHGLLDGENWLELAVFGRGWWPRDLLVEERHRIRILYRSPIRANQG